ncbi:MAG: hypothetical protein Q7W16_01310 [Coriobacteriia bacterium]|nr:hypothetical protein [Coriobacteriia bacterium]
MDPLWLYIIVAVVAILLVAGIVVASVMLWRRQVRRSIIALVGRREAVMAAYRGLESVFTSLAAADADELAAFATDATSVQRRALEELHARMRIQSEELVELALPKRLWNAADLLGTAAGVLAVETGRVGEAIGPEGVLDALGEVDVAAISAALLPANEEIDVQLAARDIGDPAVYGGGLYI